MKRLEWRNGEFVERDDAGGEVLSLPNDLDVTAAKPALDGIDVVILNFPSLRDGRAFTQAQALRRMGYGGDIRATGALFLDQIGMAVRCGFTSFSTDDLPTADKAKAVVGRYPAYYQRAYVGTPAWAARS